MIDWIREKVIVNGKLLPERSKKSWFIKNGHCDRYDEIVSQTSFLKDPTFHKEFGTFITINLFFQNVVILNVKEFQSSFLFLKVI